MTKRDLTNVIKEYFNEQVSAGNYTKVLDADELARRLIANGVEIVPVEVGDKIYWTDIIENTVREYEVSEVDEFGERYAAHDANGKSFYDLFTSIGYTVFTSRKDAEHDLTTNRKMKLQRLLGYYLSEHEWDSAREIKRLLAE